MPGPNGLPIDFAQDQEDELEALAAIWPGFSLRTGVWGGKSFAVTVTPLGLPEKQIFARVTLVLSYPARYPRVAPLLRIESSEHLTDAEVKELKVLLAQHAASLTGDRVFIHDLLALTAEFLGRCNRAPNVDHRSLWEQMQSEERRALKARQDEERLEEEKMEREELDKEAAAATKPQETALHWHPHAASPHPATAADVIAPASSSAAANALGAYAKHGALDRIQEGGGEGSDAAKEELQAFTPQGSDVDSDDLLEDEARGGLPASARASWYRSQFKEIGKIGRGGFGTVFKVRNRVDKRLYAIKKIPLDPHDKLTNKKIRREVTTISRMIHKNIVRYYHAVMEDGDEQIDLADAIMEEEENDIATSDSASDSPWGNPAADTYRMSLDASDQDSAGVDFEGVVVAAAAVSGLRIQEERGRGGLLLTVCMYFCEAVCS
eukprot:TRINITY_DN2691_c0_g1_i6.p2 TRINITY_DN2691_c0_g1~~TRINITY_DN2691_c0_g1_i6.p2  ORF type:complete len:437 (+),score=122.07 TRINITY_DN2691_c0_g1_i6:900-2210(+)